MNFNRGPNPTDSVVRSSTSRARVEVLAPSEHPEWSLREAEEWLAARRRANRCRTALLLASATVLIGLVATIALGLRP